MTIKPDSQCGRLLRVLADGKPHTTALLRRNLGGIAISSRIAELRKHGYEITCGRQPGFRGSSAYFYRLVSLPEAETQLTGPLAQIVTEDVLLAGLPEIDGDIFAPRDKSNRFRIYRLVGGELGLIATCADEAAVGMAICTLGAEGEFQMATVGILDSGGSDEKPGTWLINPYEAPLP